MSAIHETLGSVSAGILAQGGGSFWLPEQGSTSATQVDRVFALIFWISLAFFALIVSLMVLFVVRYRRRSGRGPGKTSTHNTALEMTWSIIPLILVIVIFYAGFKSFMDMRVAPAHAREILVIGQKWNWFFKYPSTGYVDTELHVPVGEPVKLVMTSEDVIHSLYVPAFRVKMDLVPGRYSTAWFEATETGSFDLYCAEYCGTGHSDMTTRVVVHEPDEFEKWLEDASNWIDTVPPAQAGETLVSGRAGCAQCHTVDGRAHTGPTFKGLFGTDRPLADGSTVTADENYIRESILEPNAKVVAGYQAIMPTGKGRLKDKEITAIIEYLKTLADE